MRIVVITNEFPTVSETFISNKVRMLSEDGHRLFVVCSRKNNALFKSLFTGNTNIRVLLLSKRRLLKYSLLYPVEITRIFFWYKNSIKKDLLKKLRVHTINRCAPDIIHFEFSGIAISFLDELGELKAKKVVSCRGSAEKVRLLVDEGRKEKTKLLFDEVDAVHCVSEDMRQTILPYCHQPEKIFINFPSIDTGFFKRASPYMERNGTVNILSAGRFTFQKGYLIGLIAVRKLKEDGIPFRWVIAGGGEQQEEIIFHIHQMQLQDEVILAGVKSREQILELYQQADIYFLPSVYEGIANAVLEAMSMELPVVCTRCGGMEEVITHRVNGLLAGVCDHDALASCLAELIQNFELRIQTGKAARLRITERFDLGLQTSRFEKVYADLLEK